MKISNINGRFTVEVEGKSSPPLSPMAAYRLSTALVGKVWRAIHRADSDIDLTFAGFDGVRRPREQVQALAKLLGCAAMDATDAELERLAAVEGDRYGLTGICAAAGNLPMGDDGADTPRIRFAE